MKVNIGSVVVGLVAVAFALGQTGCCSYAAYRYNEHNVLMRKAQATGNDVAIKAAAIGVDGAGIGINISALETIDSPKAFLLQLGGALVDVGCVYAAQQGLESLNQSSSSKVNSFTVNNGGDGSVNVNITQNTTTTTTSTTTDTRTSESDSSAGSHNDNSTDK